MISTEGLNYIPVLDINKYNNIALLKTYAESVQQAEIEAKLKMAQLARRLNTSYEIKEQEDVISSSFFSFVNPRVIKVLQSINNTFHKVFQGKRYLTQANGEPIWDSANNKWKDNKANPKIIKAQLLEELMNTGLGRNFSEALVNPLERLNTDISIDELYENAIEHNPKAVEVLTQGYANIAEAEPEVAQAYREHIQRAFSANERVFSSASISTSLERRDNYSRASAPMMTPEYKDVKALFRGGEEEEELREVPNAPLPEGQDFKSMESTITDTSAGVPFTEEAVSSTGAAAAGAALVDDTAVSHYRDGINALVNILDKIIQDGRLELQPDTSPDTIFNVLNAEIPTLNLVDLERLEEYGVVKLKMTVGTTPMRTTSSNYTLSISEGQLGDVYAELRRRQQIRKRGNIDFSDPTTSVDEAIEATQTREEFLNFNEQIYLMLERLLPRDDLIEPDGTKVSFQEAAAAVVMRLKFSSEQTTTLNSWKALFNSDYIGTNDEGIKHNLFLMKVAGNDAQTVGILFFGFTEEEERVLDKVHYNKGALTRKERQIYEKLIARNPRFETGYFSARTDTIKFENSLRSLQENVENIKVEDIETGQEFTLEDALKGTFPQNMSPNEFKQLLTTSNSATMKKLKALSSHLYNDPRFTELNQKAKDFKELLLDRRLQSLNEFERANTTLLTTTDIMNIAFNNTTSEWLTVDMLNLEHVKWFILAGGRKIPLFKVDRATEESIITTKIMPFFLLYYRAHTIAIAYEQSDPSAKPVREFKKERVPIRKPKGKGLKGKGIIKTGKIISTVKEAMNRLNILVGSIQAGNNSKELINEASNLVEFLFNEGKISKEQYKKFNKIFSSM